MPLYALNNFEIQNLKYITYFDSFQVEYTDSNTRIISIFF